MRFSRVIVDTVPGGEDHGLQAVVKFKFTLKKVNELFPVMLVKQGIIPFTSLKLNKKRLH